MISADQLHGANKFHMDMRVSSSQSLPIDYYLNQYVTLRILKTPLKAILRKILCVDQLNTKYGQIAHFADGEFFEAAINLLNINLDINDLNNIPATGRCVLVANHPYGGLDALIIMALLMRRRMDFNVLGNFVLQTVPQSQNHLISVNPFETKNIAQMNMSAVKQALKCLENDKMLLAFPAGEVSHYTLRRNNVRDKAWNPGIAKLIHKTKSPVIPIHFSGHNSWLFQAVGLIHPLIRTLLLPAELLNKQNKTVAVRVGKMIPYSEMSDLNNEELISSIQNTVYELPQGELDARKL